MMINHITYHLSQEAIGRPVLGRLMKLVGFEEVTPDDPFEHGYEVRWFKDREALWLGLDSPLIHFVASEDRTPPSSQRGLGLGHFCVVVPPERFEACRRSDYLARDSGSGRIWLEYDSGRLRIEVRSS